MYLSLRNHVEAHTLGDAHVYRGFVFFVRFMVSRRVVEDVLLGFVDSDTGDIDGMVVHGVAPGRILRLQECMGFWHVLGLDVWRYFQPQQLH